MPLKRSSPHPIVYFISAGESSGDLIGAELVLALKKFQPRLQPFGVTGPAMGEAGVRSIATISQLNIMGFAEVLKHLADLRILEQKILAQIDRAQPQFAVLIDNPGFHLRLAEQLRIRGIPVYQYVAPKLWAWGASRVKALRRDFERVLGILPFEREFFETHGVSYRYVGSPLRDRIEKVAIDRQALGFPTEEKLIACLPGSRPDEVKRIMPLLVSLSEVLSRQIPGAVFVAPLAEGLSIDTVAPGAQQSSLGEFKTYEYRGIHIVRGMSLEVMAIADAAVVTSGTATLECALLGTPLVVVYKMGELTFGIAKQAVKVPYVSLVNLIAGRRLVEEFIQDFSVDDVAKEVKTLILDQERRANLLEAFEDLRDGLEGDAANTAASIIMERVTTMKTGAPIRL